MIVPTVIEHIAETTCRFNGLNSSNQVKMQIEDIFGVRIGASSIRKIRYKFGFKRRRTTKKPYLSLATKNQRYTYCLNHRNETFNNYVFSDESTVKALEIPLYHVRFPSTHPNAVGNETNTRMKVNVWSVISKRRCPGIVVNMLLNTLIFNLKYLYKIK